MLSYAQEMGYFINSNITWSTNYHVRSQINLMDVSLSSNNEINRIGPLTFLFYRHALENIQIYYFDFILLNIAFFSLRALLNAEGVFTILMTNNLFEKILKTISIIFLAAAERKSEYIATDMTSESVNAKYGHHALF